MKFRAMVLDARKQRPRAACGQVLLAAAGAVFIATAAVAAPAADPLTLGRADTAKFYAGNVAALWASMSPEMKAGFKTPEGIAAFRAQVEAHLGKELRVLDEKVVGPPTTHLYVRKVIFANSPDPITVIWGLEPDGTIAGFVIRPAQSEPKEAASRFLTYQTQTPLHLPFDGTWAVFWGGRTIGQNYHAVSVDQRFADDLVILRDGKTHTGDGQQVADYYCYGQPIHAPAAGTVTEAVDGLPDNAIGKQDPAHAAGNHVVLDFGHGEFGLLAHLKPGSLKVKTGDVVGNGEVLGLCGNSGNTSQPHLHFHLQNGPTLFHAEGLPAQFLDYVADGLPVKRGEPVQGQFIHNPSNVAAAF